MEAGKLSRAGRNKIKEAKEREARADQAQDAVYSVVSHMERTLFIVDLSKLEAEGDTLVDALVVYRPLHEFRKSQYEQRCSQLIGLSLCMKNLTGKYPEFLLMKGTGFAIHSLGNTYVMGLSSRPDEPGSCAVAHLENICNFFRFYYQSPDAVMQSSKEDWQIFTDSMSSIFDNIMDYISTDQHSVPAMLRPLPYLNPQLKGKQGSMLCMRLLRTCQKYSPIIGGCVMHNSKLATSQFPPSLTEMLILVGGKGVDLEHRSVLEDNIAPGKVWILEVFLTREESNVAKDQRKDLTAFQASYASLDANSQLASVHWKFQSNTHSSKSSGDSIKDRRNWRRKTVTPVQKDKGRRKGSTLEPVASSTPHQGPPHNPRASSSSLKSEDAIVVSPGMSKVSFMNHSHTTSSSSSSSTHGTASNRVIQKTANLTLSPSRSSSKAVPSPAPSPNTGNETDELYMDAVDNVDPTEAIGPEMLRMFSRSTSHPNGDETNTSSAVKEDSGTADFPLQVPLPPSSSFPSSGKSREVEPTHTHGTGSTSSEGFATPSPTPPRTFVGGPSHLGGLAQAEDSSVPDVTGSFKTVPDRSLLEEDSEGGGGAGGGASQRHSQNDTGKWAGKHGRSSQHKANGLRVVSDGGGGGGGGGGDETNSDSDDFVDMDDVDDILRRVAREKGVEQSKLPSSPPPPVPRRGGAVATAPTSETPPIPPARGSQAGVLLAEAPPPTPPARGNSAEAPPIPPVRENLVEAPPIPPVREASTEAAPTPPVRSNSAKAPPPLPARGNPARTHVRAETGNEDHPPPPVPPRMNEGAVATGDLGAATAFVPPTTGLSVGVTGETLYTEKDIQGAGDGGGATGKGMATSNEGVKDKGTAALRDRIFDDQDYEDIDAEVARIELEKALKNSSTPTKRKNDSDYEEIDDEPVIGCPLSEVRPSIPPKTSITPPALPRPRGSGHKREGLGEGEEVHDTEDSESKNSSMTVTLDLSHISKDDIMYGSREKVGGGGGGGGGGGDNSSSVDLASISINMPNSDSSTEEAAGDGTVTPVEMTYNDSMLGFLQAKFEQQQQQRMQQQQQQQRGRGLLHEEPAVSSGLNDSGEYSSLPDEDENVFNSDEEVEDSVYDQPVLPGKAQAKNWMAHTMDRRKIDSEEVEKYSLYVQQYMNTFIVLLADSGLQHKHHILNELWRLLAEQLISVEMSFEKAQQRFVMTGISKTSACTVTYSGYEKLCEAHPESAAYHYRHAVRRAHQEYLNDPSLRQISLSKEHCRMLCQSVHNREVYYQPSKMSGDALSLHSVLERQAKLKCSLRQQPIGGPKVMFI